MLKERGRLLIMLVLLATALTAAWTTAQARPREGTRSVRSYSTASALIVSQPGARPASGQGEPDGGATKIPPVITGGTGLVSDEEGTDSPASVWFSWISRIWMARLLGV